MHSVFILQCPASRTVRSLMQRNCEGLVRVKFTTVIARSEATWQSVILRNARERKMSFSCVGKKRTKRSRLKGAFHKDAPLRNPS